VTAFPGVQVADLALVDREGGPLRLVVVVAVDPDDETLGAKGLLAALSQPERDIAVEVVSFTDGAGPAATWVDRLTEHIGDGRGVLLVAPWRHDGHPDHPDHEAAGRAAAAVATRTGARLLEYPLWFWHWAEPAHAPRESMVAFPPGHLPGPQDLFVEESADDPALERIHREGAEPWGADTRWYEERKRSLLLAMLPDRELGRVLELGCSTGVTSVALAARSRDLVAIDSSGSAVAAARARLAGVPGVDVREGSVPEDWPSGRFDTVVVSELGYFLHPGALERTVAAVRSCLTDDGVVLLCHWRHPVAGWVLDGVDVHAAFSAVPSWTRLAQYVDEDVEILLLGPAGRLPEPTR